MEAKYSDIEFAKLMRYIPIGYYLVVPIKGPPFFRKKL